MFWGRIAGGSGEQLRPIEEDGGPEVAEWNQIMEPYLGKSWLDTPWLYSEFYAYRRVVEAFTFFKTGEVFREEARKTEGRIGRDGVGCGMAGVFQDGRTRVRNEKSMIRR